jgi:PIN domain nuclease of toxin-antitoxin system
VSVLLDFLDRLPNEPGRNLVARAIASDAVMSSVNLAEVMTILVREGVSPKDAEFALAKLPVTVHTFDDVLAPQAGGCSW